MTDNDKEKSLDKIIDRELLISSVEQRPVLWDKFLDLYKDKVAKTAAWREICSILNENYEEMEQKEQQLFRKCVIKRWTQIRDAWLKTLHNNKKPKKSGSATVSVRPYRYHTELQFLKKVIDAGDTHDNVSIRNKNEEAVEENENDGQKTTEIKQYNKKTARYLKCLNPPIRKKQLLSEADDEMISLSNHQQPKEAEEDRNLNFFKSILPSLKALDDDQTLEFHSGVINLIQTIKRRTPEIYWSQNSHSYHNQYQGYSTKREHSQSPSSASTSTQFDPVQLSPELSGPTPEPVPSPLAVSTSTQTEAV